MTRNGIRWIAPAALAALAALELGGCVVYPARGYYGRREVVVAPLPPPVVVAPAPEPPPDVVVDVAPPPPQVEVFGAPPGPDFIWVGGFWDRRGPNWFWVGGHWDRPPRPGVRWYSDRWERGPHGYVRVRGGWR
jgi:hypothetical protein